MPDDEVAPVDVGVWLDPGGGIVIKAVTASQDPVELSTLQACELALRLLRLAARDR